MFMLFCVVFMMMIGCEAPEDRPTGIQRSWANNEREKIKHLMRGIESRIRDSDPEGIMRSYVYAGTSPERRHQNYLNFKRASWTLESSGYHITDLGKALEELHWRELNNGRVALEVEAACARGRRWKDRFHLYRPEDEWLVAAAQLRPPEPGRQVELSVQDAEGLTSLAQEVLEKFRNNDFGEVPGMLPNTFEARYSTERPGPLGRLFSREPRIRAFEDDLRRVSALHIERWPDPPEGLPAKFAGGMSVFLPYEVAYTAGEADGRAQEFGLEVYATENRAKEWELRKLRFRDLPAP